MWCDRQAEERAIDPLLMLSLIRQESLFNTLATAAAGEKGLTQVIPPTAQYIADQAGLAAITSMRISFALTPASPLAFSTLMSS